MIKVSASTLDRVSVCPGSVKAEQGMPYTESEAAKEGNLLHEVMSGQRSTAGLTSGQRRYINQCGEVGRELIVEHVDSEKPEIVKEWYSQVRLYDGIVSAKVDFAAWGDTKALVIDWKFGHNPVERAEANLQLRPYACMVAQESLTIELVTVAIVQPTVAPEDRVTVCQYTLDDIRQAREELNAILKGVSEHQDTRIPGEHCRYCKAVGTTRCPESASVITEIAPVKDRDILPSGAELAKLLDMAVVLEPQINRLREHARAEIQAGNAIPGWAVSADFPTRNLPDVEAAWAAAEAAGVTPAEFTRACKVTVGNLEDVLREKFGWRAKDTKAEFSKVMGEAIVMETRRGSLRKSN